MQEDARKTPAEGIAGASPELLVQKFSPLPTNARLGELTVQSVLGAGENGITYICVHDGNNRRFVVKEYLPRSIAFRDGLTVRVSSANTPNYAWGLDRFLEEARALAKIKHPAVVSVLAAMEGNGTGYMVMTHETGRDLGIWQHELRRPPTQQECDKLAEGLLDGVKTLHARQILHLDIQPAHIIVRDGDTPVLADFGAVRLAMRKRLQLPAPVEALAYMAPEVIAGDAEVIGPHSDIYSLAAVLYTLVTGAPPVEAGRRALRDTLTSATQAARVKLRPGFLQAIDQGLSYRPDDRPQSIAAWVDDLFRPETASRKVPSAKAADATETTAGAAVDDPNAAARSGTSADEEVAEPLMENPAFRPVFFGLAGGMIGALAGALSSIVVASIVSSSCMANSCVAPVVPYTTAIGLLAGAYFGARYGRMTAGSAARTSDLSDEL